MKYQFEVEDIICGNWIIKVTHPLNDANHGFARTVTFKIGFVAKTSEYCITNALTYGMVLTFKSKEDLLKMIQKENYRPLYKEELLNLITSITNFTRTQ